MGIKKEIWLELFGPTLECPKCKVVSETKDFYFNQTGPWACKSCHSIWRKENRKDPEVMRRHKEGMRRVHLNKVYGLSEIEYNKLLELQSGGCAICKQPCRVHERLSVDHDHNTGAVRGLLCQQCNSAIGFLKEDEDIIWNMLEYLKKHTWSKVA